MFRTGQFSLKVGDGQFFSQPEVVNVQAVSRQVMEHSLGTAASLGPFGALGVVTEELGRS